MMPNEEDIEITRSSISKATSYDDNEIGVMVTVEKQIRG